MELSNKSLSRLAFVAQNSEVQFLSMMTLTYPCAFPSDGKQVKKHLNKFLTYARRKFGKFSYLWFLEFQKRRAPHIHILVTLPGPSTEQRIRYGEMWSKIVTTTPKENQDVRYVHIRDKAWEKIRDKDGAIKYVTSYALKPYQKQVPPKFSNVGRFWGTSQDVPPSECKVIPASEQTVRALLKNINHKTNQWDVIPRYILNVQRSNIDERTPNQDT